VLRLEVDEVEEGVQHRWFLALSVRMMVVDRHVAISLDLDVLVRTVPNGVAFIFEVSEKTGASTMDG
jgi:hypothetical protein